MDRRDFLRKSAIGTLGLTLSPALFNSCGTSASKETSSDRLQLSFKPYDLKLKHAFNLAKSSRTHTPDVQVQLRFGEWTGYGEASMPPLSAAIDENKRKYFILQIHISPPCIPFSCGIQGRGIYPHKTTIKNNQGSVDN